MSTATDLAKTSTKAGFNYLWGLVISTIISSLGTIYIADVMGAEVYGLYGMAFVVPNMIMVFRDWGVNSAMVRYTAKYRAEKREAEIKSIFFVGILFEIIVGLGLSLLSFFLSGYIVTNMYGELSPENAVQLVSLIQIVSFSILAGGLISAATAVFTGMEKTIYYSVMLICQCVVKTLLIVGLFVAGFGVSGATVGFTFSSIIAGVVGMVFVLLLYRKMPKDPLYKLNIKFYLKKMLKYSIPLSIAAIVAGFLAQFYGFILPRFYGNNIDVIGNYNLAGTFVVLISFFSLPITNMLFPAFSKLDIKKDKIAFKNVFQLSVKYSALLVIPVTFIVMCLSSQAVTTLFGDKYSLTPLFLMLSAVNFLFAAAGSLSTGNILNSQGQTKLNLKFSILTAVIGFPMGYLLIMNYGVFGLIFTSTVAPIPSFILCIIWIKKHYELSINWVSSVKILVSAAVTAVLTYLMVNSSPINGVSAQISTMVNVALTYLPLISLSLRSAAISLIIGTFFYIFVLLGVLMLTKTLSTNDIINLREMSTGLGFITKIIHLVLNSMEKIMIKFKLT
ncbi:MAG: oligosaccharide flippase family protein [Candidatus Bathyarchaeota archaeon]|nr:oligosaccharide flippase family protein [Candidatus Termiticorpusculum sp.]